MEGECVRDDTYPFAGVKDQLQQKSLRGITPPPHLHPFQFFLCRSRCRLLFQLSGTGDPTVRIRAFEAHWYHVLSSVFLHESGGVTSCSLLLAFA